MMTWNLAVADAQAWAARRAAVHALLAREAPDILCVQEAMPHQIADLTEWLPGHHLVAGAPDARGERNAVFVLSSRYDVLDRGTEKVAGNDEFRAATWVRLQDRSMGRSFVVVNTHLDHESRASRLAAAERIRALFPGAIVAGDLNTEPGSEAFEVLHEGRVDPFPEEGAETMHGWRGHADARLDAILLPPDIHVEEARLLRTEASDHHALSVDIAPEAKPRRVDEPDE